MIRITRLAPLALVASLAFFSAAARGNFYVGNDTRSGSNNGHLTLLYGHTDHFHRIGVFGGAEGRIPEASAGGPLLFAQGTGVMAGRFVSAPYEVAGDPTSSYSDLTIRSLTALAGFPAGSPETVLYNGGARYQGSLLGASLALELVSLSANLNVGDSLGNRILTSVGDRYNLGAAASFSPFAPTFFTNVGAAPGVYSATFRLVDLNGVLGQSGTFRYEFQAQAQAQAVPEPASLALTSLGLGAVGLAGARRRRQAAPVPTS